MQAPAEVVPGAVGKGRGEAPTRPLLQGQQAGAEGDAAQGQDRSEARQKLQLRLAIEVVE